ncbi:MAG: KamA family radical SAM protein [Verrucomicrobia bacterium]|nr:KamA family radical SAM protein [Verrucomicrobiota bacterium]
MQREESSSSDEPPSGESLSKTFISPGKGHWRDVRDEDWNNYRWQLQHRLTNLNQISALMQLTPEEEAGFKLSGHKLATAITPYFFNLVEADDPGGPIRRQVIPRIEETHTASWEMADPCGEESHSPVPGLVHRYPDRVLLLVTDRCATYCRYCTRSRLVSGASDYDFHPKIEQALAYIREHREVRDVLISGGDPLLLSDEKLDWLLGRIRAISHVELVRIGSRIPVFLPQRITPELCAMLRRHQPLWMSIHSNHPRECTPEMKTACERLSDAGIPLGNQSVLLRGVNDDPATMKALLQKLLMMRVRPYYIYQCDLIAGSSHLRSSVSRGLEIMQSLRGHTTGYAVPQYVIDAPGGGGKVPVSPEYVVYRDEERVIFRNYEGKIFEYPEALPETSLQPAKARQAEVV